AMLAAGLLEIRRLPGVNRPAIAVVLPTRLGPSVLIDSGANADGRAEHLRQFAHMGSVFAQEILGIVAPEVRLLSIGEEPEKGNQLTLEAHRMLVKEDDLDFRGNTESRNLLEGAADVVVCDGFTGNVVLKALERTISTVLGALREEITASRRAKLGGLLIRPAARRLRNPLHPQTLRRWVPQSGRPRYLWRCVSARVARAGRGRARELRPPGHCERDPPCRPRRRT